MQNLASYNLVQGMTAVGVLGALHMDVITDIAWSCNGRALAVSTHWPAKPPSSWHGCTTLLPLWAPACNQQLGLQVCEDHQ